MEFQFWVPENVRLPARISQWSNLKYIKIGMDNLDDRLRANFRNSCLSFLADVPEIQFFTQLIQALVCREIHCDRSHELRFNVQGHLTWFGLQEYAIITRLHARSFSEGDRYTKALEKRRLKEKYFKSLEKISCAQLEKTFVCASTPRADRYKLGLALIVKGVITASDNNVGIDDDTLSLVDDLELFFSYPCVKVGYRRLLKGFRGTWARKMSDAKTKNEKNISYTIHEFPIAIQLHVHATLRPTEAEHDLPYITSLVSFPDCPVQFLDDLARSVVGLQFHEVALASGGHEDSAADDRHDDKSGAGAEDDETSPSDDRLTPEGSRDDGSKADDSGDSGRDTSSETGAGDTEDDEDTSGRQSAALPTPMVAPSTSGVQGTRGGPTVTRDNVEGILLDQRILFEMRLRTVKLEIIQHVIEEFAKLRDFISTLVPSSGGTSTSVAAPVMNEPYICDDPHEAGEGSDKRSRHDDDHADEGEMQEVKDGDGGEERSPQDDDRAEEGDMQEVNDPRETIPTLPGTRTRKVHRPITSRRWTQTPDTGRQQIHLEGRFLSSSCAFIEV
ncbi:Hypothetical predicted protein [Olea europaea subsp. europaea]|uniref:DUF1985 domain-containing protein n=1 Tax=Olea europaea subsp. europaea TaxID=158383 RepID=A0A8S0QKM8_OLEEU|nr:Hypothetical predicted protein [Olea europaea subsp. europaea]